LSRTIITIKKSSNGIYNATFDSDITHGFSMAYDKDKAITGAISQLKKHLDSDDISYEMNDLSEESVTK